MVFRENEFRPSTESFRPRISADTVKRLDERIYEYFNMLQDPSVPHEEWDKIHAEYSDLLDARNSLERSTE